MILYTHRRVVLIIVDIFLYNFFINKRLILVIFAIFYFQKFRFLKLYSYSLIIILYAQTLINS